MTEVASLRNFDLIPSSYSILTIIAHGAESFLREIDAIFESLKKIMIIFPCLFLQMQASTLPSPGFLLPIS